MNLTFLEHNFLGGILNEETDSAKNKKRFVGQ